MMAFNARSKLVRNTLAGSVLLLVMAFLLGACGSPEPTATPTQEATPTADDTQDPDTSGEEWEQQWEQLVSDAQEEGQLVVAATGGSGRVMDEPIAAFVEEYGIEVTITRGSGTEQVERILAEKGAGRHEVDVGYIHHGTADSRYIPNDLLDEPMPLLFHPDVIDTSKWWQDQIFFSDSTRQHLIAWVADFTCTSSFWINTNLMSDADVAKINSTHDFLDEEWKGKIVASDPKAYVAQTYVDWYYDPNFGPEFVRAIIQDNDVEFPAELRQIEDGLPSGKWHIALNVGAAGNALTDLAERGLPIELIDKDLGEPCAVNHGTEGNLAVFNEAPHPNAAQLFLNWQLSREGHLAYHDRHPTDPRQSMRLDVPFDRVLEAERRQEGKQYSVGPIFETISSEKFNEAQAQIVKWVDGIE